MKTVINTKTKGEFIAVLAIFQYVKKWVWSCGDKPLDFIDNWNKYKENTCISFENDFGYCYKEYYEKEGYKIISFEEFLEIKDKKICKFCGQVIRE